MKIRIIERGGSYIVQYRKFFIWWNDKAGKYGESWVNNHTTLSLALERVAKLKQLNLPHPKPATKVVYKTII